MTSHATLLSAPVVDLVARAGVGLTVAVRPWELEGVGELVRTYQGAGVRLGLWPMLADRDGRWGNAGNAELFVQLLERCASAALEVGVAPEITLDLEPPIDELGSWLHGHWTRGAGKVVRRLVPASAERARLVRATHTFARGVERLRGLGVLTSAVVLPVLALPGGTLWQRALGTPHEGLCVDRTIVMTYTSLVEGYAPRILGRAVVTRPRVRWGLRQACRLARRRFGAEVEVAVGAVGIGALGDEPVYRSPDELADDVEIARAAGITNLSLFDLGGVLGRPPAERWLEAFTRLA